MVVQWRRRVVDGAVRWQVLPAAGGEGLSVGGRGGGGVTASISAESG